jgi:alpha-glucosidase
VIDAAWWRHAVVYEIYPRSFQDSGDDGLGDLPGVTSRLGHVAGLNVDAILLSPTFPSPLADFGFDVSDFEDVDPVYGTLDDFDELVAAAHGHGLRVLMNMVPCHTSIEHPWFREHPDWYVRVEGDGPPNNWETAFGGPAWSPDPLRHGWWYLHSFYPEQPNLDWSNPEVVAAMQAVIRYWIARGVDGFRLDAIDRLGIDPELRDDPPRTGPPPLPALAAGPQLDPVYSRDGPGIAAALRHLREAAGDHLLVGEVYLPAPHVRPYLEHVDLAFCFELLHADFDAQAIAKAVRRALLPGGGGRGLAWVLSNIDFPRLASRVGAGAERVAALLLLTLPGVVFIHQGDEIGMTDGPGATPSLDRAGRDTHRHPMQWERSPHGGFTTGAPWLPLIDPAARNVADQDRDPLSLLALYRAATSIRQTLGDGIRVLDDVPEGLLAYLRGPDTMVVLNLTREPRPCPVAGRVILDTEGRSDRPAPATIPPLSGLVIRTH